MYHQDVRLHCPARVEIRFVCIIGIDVDLRATLYSAWKNDQDVQKWLPILKRHGMILFEGLLGQYTS